MLELFDSGPHPSQGLTPVVKMLASGVFQKKIFLISKSSAPECEDVVQSNWKLSSVSSLRE